MSDFTIDQQTKSVYIRNVSRNAAALPTNPEMALRVAKDKLEETSRN